MAAWTKLFRCATLLGCLSVLFLILYASVYSRPELLNPIEEQVYGLIKFNDTGSQPIVDTATVTSTLQNLHDTTVLPRTRPLVGNDHVPQIELPWTTIRDGTPQLFSAYYDDRDIPLKGRPAVVVLGYHPIAVSSMTMYCKLTFSSKATPTICLKNPATKHFIYGSWAKVNKRSKPMEYVCQLECKDKCTDESIPVLVGLSSIADCSDASADIPVHNRAPHDPTRLKGFGVCVQTPVFDKSPQQITDFIEMNRALGAGHITLYVMDINKQLDHFFSTTYYEKDLLEVVKWRNFGAWTEMHYYGELLVMQDCLYRHMNRVKYVAFVDMDELILPLKHSNWSDMMTVLDTNPKRSTFVFLNTYFTDNPRRTNVSKPCKEMDIPIYFKWTRRYVCRLNYGIRSKYMAKPRLVNDLDIHEVHTFRGYPGYNVPIATAMLAHYRNYPASCPKNLKTTEDTTVMRFKSQVMKAVQQKICVRTGSQ